MKKTFLILIALLLATTVQAQRLPFTYEVKENRGMYYAYFYKDQTISDKELIIHYRMVFPTNRSSQNRMATILSTGSQDRSQGVNEWFRIEITNWSVSGGGTASPPQSSSSSESSSSAAEDLRRQHKTSVGTVAPESVVWAEMNVGADYIEESGHYFTFKKAQKACPDGWRLPTIAEFQSLFDVKSEWTTEEGKPGRRYYTGRQTVFFPAAGAWGTGANSGRRAFVPGHIFGGLYWAAGRVADGEGGGFKATKDGSWTITARISNEYTVRCVRK